MAEYSKSKTIREKCSNKEKLEVKKDRIPISSETLNEKLLIQLCCSKCSEIKPINSITSCGHGLCFECLIKLKCCPNCRYPVVNYAP
jgi:hypothetical protein